MTGKFNEPGLEIKYSGDIVGTYSCNEDVLLNGEKIGAGVIFQVGNGDSVATTGACKLTYESAASFKGPIDISTDLGDES